MANQYYALNPGPFRLDGGAMFGIIPRPLWEKRSSADNLNRIDLSLRVFVIKTADRLILIDTGAGGHRDLKFRQRFGMSEDKHPLEASLKCIGFSCEQVTDVILTHLHFDHAGGLGCLDNQERITPVFPQATLHLHQKHYEYAQGPTLRDQGSFFAEEFVPLVEFYKKNNQIQWYDAEEGRISIDRATDLSYICSHGHTPYQIHPFDKKVFCLADTAPTSHHIDLPWVMGYDLHPGVSVEVKERFFCKLRDENLVALFGHDSQFWGARIHQEENQNTKRWKWSKKFEVQADELAEELLELSSLL